MFIASRSIPPYPPPSQLTAVVLDAKKMGLEGAKFTGTKNVLIFDKEASQLLSVKAWANDAPNSSDLGRVQCGDRVIYSRLNVVQPSAKGETAVNNENSFLFSLAYGRFSSLQVIAHAGDGMHY